MYNVHLPIMLESERQAVYRERKKERSNVMVKSVTEVTQRLDVDVGVQ